LDILTKTLGNNLKILIKIIRHVKISCPNCGNDDFTQDLEDERIFICNGCSKEIVISLEGEGTLTPYQRKMITK